MKQLRTLAGCLALVAVLVAGSPAVAADPERKKDDLQTEINKLRKDLEQLRQRVLQNEADANRVLRSIDERMAHIEDGLTRLSAGASTRSSFSYTPPVPMPTGTLRLYNTMATTATVVVDGITYSVPPYSMQTLANRPAGALIYQVTANGVAAPAVRSTIAPNETLTVRIFPTVQLIPLE